jgi:hypothetical protein
VGQHEAQRSIRKVKISWSIASHAIGWAMALTFTAIALSGFVLRTEDVCDTTLRNHECVSPCVEVATGSVTGLCQNIQGTCCNGVCGVYLCEKPGEPQYECSPVGLSKWEGGSPGEGTCPHSLDNCGSFPHSTLKYCPQLHNND